MITKIIYLILILLILAAACYIFITNDDKKSLLLFFIIFIISTAVMIIILKIAPISIQDLSFNIKFKIFEFLAVLSSFIYLLVKGELTLDSIKKSFNEGKNAYTNKIKKNKTKRDN